MEQTKNTSPMISGLDIVKLILKKLKLIICIALAIAIVGGAATMVAGLGEATYGNTLDFYLVTTDSTESLLPLLQSEAFAEKLLLDEYGLPAELAGTEDYENAKKNVIAFNDARDQLAVTTALYKKLDISLTTPKDDNGNVISSYKIISQKYTELKEDYDNLYKLLQTYKTANTEGIVTEEHKAETQRLESELAKAKAALDHYKEIAYLPALRERAAVQDKYNFEFRIVGELRDKADASVEKVVSTWRADEEVRKEVAKIARSLTFVYGTPAESVTDVLDGQDDKNAKQNISFLKVQVEVKGDQELADEIIESLKLRLPDFAEKNVERLTAIPTATCTLISPFSYAVELSGGASIADAVLVAALAGVIALIVACFVIVGRAWVKAIEATDKDETEDKSKA